MATLGAKVVEAGAIADGIAKLKAQPEEPGDETVWVTKIKDVRFRVISAPHGLSYVHDKPRHCGMFRGRSVPGANTIRSFNSSCQGVGPST